MRDHPFILMRGRELGLGYDEAEAVVRGMKTPEAQAAVAQVDAARAKTRDAAAKLNADMAGRLGLPLPEVAELLSTLAADGALETWFLRRLNLTRAHGRPPADDEHPQNG